MGRLNQNYSRHIRSCGVCNSTESGEILRLKRCVGSEGKEEEQKKLFKKKGKTGVSFGGRNKEGTRFLKEEEEEEWTEIGNSGE